MKIIFLDIDGVLNLMRQDRDDYGRLFHDEFIENLKWIVDETDVKIVITSTWRGDGLTKMQDMWKHRNYPSEVIGITPFLFNSKVKYIDRECEVKNAHDPRGIEIYEWLQEKDFNRISWSKEEQIELFKKTEIVNYVILDDDTDMLLSQAEHFVRTSCQYNEPDAIEGYGLTKTAAEKAIRILKTPIIDLYYTNK